MNIKQTSIVTNAITIISIIAAVLAFTQLNMSYDRLAEANEQKATFLLLSDELRQSSRDLTNNVRMYAVTGDAIYKKAYQDIVDERAGKIPRAQDKKLFPGEKYDLVELLKKMGVGAEELALVQEANQLSNSLVPLELEAMYLVEGIYKDASGAFTIKGEPDKTQAMSLVFGKKYVELVTPVGQILDRFAQQLDVKTDAWVVENQKTVDFQEIIVYCALACIFIFGMISLWFNFVRVVNPLNRTMDFAVNIAEGNLDLHVPVHSNNEIGKLNASLDTMVQSLKAQIQAASEQAEHAKKMGDEARKAMDEAKKAHALAESAKRDGMLTAAQQLEGIVQGVSSASTQLMAQIQGTEQGTKNAAARIEETVTAMEEMNATVLEVARSAGSAAHVSQDAKAKAEEGAGIVEQVITCIADVEQQSIRMKNDMENLGHQAEAIGSIMNVISDIADQTNLLALNAAIEAARAGEAGRGFAVVADEVRKLAEKTMHATVEVGSAIRGIQSSAEHNMQNVDVSNQGIAKATDFVRQAGEALQEIVGLVDSSADQVRTIATAAEEQSATSEEINHSLGAINNAASDSVRAMKEAEQAISDLSQQAHSLTKLIDEMKRG